MPTYTYRCSECGHQFDVFHGISQTGDRECTACGAAAQRLIGTGAGLIFKGSGFYETDYKRKNGNGSNGSSHSHSSNGHTTSSVSSSNGSSSTSSNGSNGTAASSSSSDSAPSTAKKSEASPA